MEVCGEVGGEVKLGGELTIRDGDRGPMELYVDRDGDRGRSRELYEKRSGEACVAVVIKIVILDRRIVALLFLSAFHNVRAYN